MGIAFTQMRISDKEYHQRLRWWYSLSDKREKDIRKWGKFMENQDTIPFPDEVKHLNHTLKIIDTALTKAREDVLRLDREYRILTLSVQDYANAEESKACAGRFMDYNTLDSVELYSGGSKISLADAVNTEEVYYNLWGKTGTISYGLKSEYHVNSFDKIVVKSGCEFPAYSYTQTDSLDKTAYTVSSQQTVNLTPETHKVRYYDTNHNLLYTDDVASGTELSLRKAPKREGYEASWSGMTYTLMPAEDISYVLTYETYTASSDMEEGSGSGSGEGQETAKDGQSNDTESPDTGDLNNIAGTLFVMILAGAVFTAVLVIKRKSLSKLFKRKCEWNE